MASFLPGSRARLGDRIPVLAFLVGLGFVFVPQGCGGVPPATEMPESIARPIRGCAVEHKRHLGDSDQTVTFDAHFDSDGQVTAISLVESTLGDEELEKCIAASIRSISLGDLPLRSSQNLEGDVARPESRTLLGHPLTLAACLASPPCLLALTVLAGATYITVNIVVQSATATSTAIPAPIATAWPMATAKPTATTTAPPIALPRKFPNQTCEEEERIRLEAAKEPVCKHFPGKSCSPKSVSEKHLAKYPCSLIKARIVAVQACVAARQKVQDECFKNATDTGHADEIQQLIDGIQWCELLKVPNCAPGHPMSGL